MYAVPGKEPFYQRLGFERMTTAMAIFEDELSALKDGYIKESSLHWANGVSFNDRFSNARRLTGLLFSNGFGGPRLSPARRPTSQIAEPPISFGVKLTQSGSITGHPNLAS